MNDLWPLIFYLGIAQGIFLCVALLLLKRKRRISIYLIVAILLCFLSLIVFELLKNSLSHEQILTMYKLGGTIPLVIGPLFLCYVLSLVQMGFKITRSLLVHFLPFLFFLTYYSASVLGFLGNTLSLGVFGILKGIHTLIYFGISYRILKKHAETAKKGIKNWYNSRLFLRLIVLQILAILIIYTLVAIETFYPDVRIETDRIAALVFTFFFFAFAFALILYPNEMIPDSALKTHYYLSSLKDSHKKEILSKVLQVLDQDKLYLNPELSLNALARKLDINSVYVSQVINELLDKNFNQLINEYRVAEVKRNIMDDKRTLLGIAYDSGFNSKSAFNRLFKEIEGETPSEFKNNLMKRS